MLVHKITRLSVLYLTILLATIPVTIKASNLPDLGEPNSVILTASEEEALGWSVFEEIRKQATFIEDPIALNYVQSIATRLNGAMANNSRPVKLFILKDNSINAFAIPGAMIGLNSGLVLASDSESELASVIAHEISHIQLNHIAQGYQQMNRIRMTSIAGLAAAILLSTQSGEAAQGALVATQAAGMQSMLNFTREHEGEADYLGINALAQGGFDPMGMPNFFARLEQANRFDHSEIPEYLRTHPLTATRLSKAKERAEHFPYRQIPNSQMFYLVKERLNLLEFHNPLDALKHYQQILKHKGSDKLGSQSYALGLSYYNNQEFSQAKSIFQKLLDDYPEQALFQVALAQTHHQLEEITQAKALYETSLSHHPYHDALTHGYALFLIESKEPQKAVQLLRTFLVYKSHSAKGYQLLARAYAVLGKEASALLTQANYLDLLGFHRQALSRLRLASRVPDITSQEKLRVFAKIEEIERKKIH